MARQSQPNSPGTKAAAREAGARIPDKPRDCGPNVDTWPILDEHGLDQQAGTAKPKTGEHSRSRATR